MSICWWLKMSNPYLLRQPSPFVFCVFEGIFPDELRSHHDVSIYCLSRRNSPKLTEHVSFRDGLSQFGQNTKSNLLTQENWMVPCQRCDSLQTKNRYKHLHLWISIIQYASPKSMYNTVCTGYLYIYIYPINVYVYIYYVYLSMQYIQVHIIIIYIWFLYHISPLVPHQPTISSLPNSPNFTGLVHQPPTSYHLTLSLLYHPYHINHYYPPVN